MSCLTSGVSENENGDKMAINLQLIIQFCKQMRHMQIAILSPVLPNLRVSVSIG